jgi:UDP-N-acetylglucosamine 2-epimerase
VSDARRKIAVVTTSRADYSHLYWPLRTLAERADVDLRIIVLGAHLSSEFGKRGPETEKILAVSLLGWISLRNAPANG